jgi:hypothetical protein
MWRGTTLWARVYDVDVLGSAREEPRMWDVRLHGTRKHAVIDNLAQWRSM